MQQPVMDFQVQYNKVKIGQNFSVSFQRTLRIPDNNNTYNLPPSLGAFPVEKVDDYANRVPAHWRARGGVFIPMRQSEAMYLQFEGSHSSPSAVKVAVGNVNALSGEQWNQQLVADKNDYLVVPDQPWLDGIAVGNGVIRQFIAMPLGSGTTVEAQVTGKEDVGGIQLLCFAAKQTAPTVPSYYPQLSQPQQQSSGFSFGSVNSLFDGFAAAPAPAPTSAAFGATATAPIMSSFGTTTSAAPTSFSFGSAAPAGQEMGLAAGGKMKQKIYTDKYGVQHWDQNNFGRVFIHICNSTMYEQITGKKLPESPVNRQVYMQHNIPWLDLYDEHIPSISGSSTLAQVKSIGQLQQTQPNAIVELNVGGTVFYMKQSTLQALTQPEVIGALKDSSGKVFIDRDPELFKYVANCLRISADNPFGATALNMADILPNSRTLLNALRAEATYFRFQSMADACARKLQTLDQQPQPQQPCSSMQLIAVKSFPNSTQLLTDNGQLQYKAIPHTDVRFTLPSAAHVLINWFIADSAGEYIVNVDGSDKPTVVATSGISINGNVQCSWAQTGVVKYLVALNAGQHHVQLKYRSFNRGTYYVNGPVITEVYAIDSSVVQQINSTPQPVQPVLPQPLPQPSPPYTLPRPPNTLPGPPLMR